MVGSVIAPARNAPAVIAGSSDSLLEWAVRKSRCGLATMTYRSMDGIDRLIAGAACGAAMHIPSAQSASATTNDRNLGVAQDRLAHLDCVMLQWARREQGLVVAPQNPLSIKSIQDVAKPKVRVIVRLPGAGSSLLFLQLSSTAGLSPDKLSYVNPPAQTESDVAAAIFDGRADTGLAVRAVAHQFHLDFIPLTTERLDLVILRASYFDPPLQALFAFTRRPLIDRYTKSLAGYDVRDFGSVMWDA